MTFLLYERFQNNGIPMLRPTGGNFSLAGYNLLYSAWQSRGCPLDQGWHVSADELIGIHTQGEHTTATRCLLIDFDPNSTSRIGLIELLDVYAFTWSYGTGIPVWSPLMLHMRNILYEEHESELTEAKKTEIIGAIAEPSTATDFVEFLYLKGPRWTWGKNGMTNAAFLEGDARAYFKKFM